MALRGQLGSRPLNIQLVLKVSSGDIVILKVPGLAACIGARIQIVTLLALCYTLAFPYIAALLGSVCYTTGFPCLRNMLRGRIPRVSIPLSGVCSHLIFW